MEHLVIVLITLPGVWCGEWSVTVKNQCFLRGTSAVIQCSYDYPYWHSVRKVQWYKSPINQRARAVTQYPFEFVGDMSHNCNLRINNIRNTEEGFYFFKFETNWDKWTSNKVFISVRELTASVQPPTVTEGQFVTLTCSGCSTQRNFVWIRNGQILNTFWFKASKADAGRYSCTPLGEERIWSDVSLNVQYAPQNVIMLMNPSEDIMLGSEMTFSCSSEANPPVTHSGYSLFKDGHFISHGQHHNISEVHLSDNGQYYCQAGNNITSRGSSLFQSSKVDVNVQYPPTNVSISMNSAEVDEGSVVNLTCHSNANPPAFGYTWYKVDPTSSSVLQVGSGPVLSLSAEDTSHSAQYMCQTWNRHGEQNSTELLLAVNTKGTVTSVPILAGIGVFLLIALTLMLLLYWKKQKRRSDKQMTELSETHSSAAVACDEESADQIYVNTQKFHTRSSEESAYENSFTPEEVFYTTVTIKPKRKRENIQTFASKDDSVIYTTIVKSS